MKQDYIGPRENYCIMHFKYNNKVGCNYLVRELDWGNNTRPQPAELEHINLH